MINPKQGSHGVVADLLVVEGEDLRAHAEDCHADGGGDCGVEDRVGVAGVQQHVDVGCDLKAHDEREQEKEAEGKRGGVACGADGEDQAEGDDEVEPEHAGGRGDGRDVDADRGGEEADGGDDQHLASSEEALRVRPKVWAAVRDPLRVDDDGIIAVVHDALLLKSYAYWTRGSMKRSWWAASV